jgi:hypothetical protein
VKTNFGKLLLLMLASFGTLPFGSVGATFVPSGAVSGIWTLEGSPFVVQGGIVVTQASALNIEAGVVVKFEANASLIVYGTLIATGRVDQRIVFTSISNAPSADNWQGVWIIGGPAQATLDLVEISFATEAVRIDATSSPTPIVTVSRSDVRDSRIGIGARSSPGGLLART